MKAQLDSISLAAKNSQRLRDFYVTVFGLEENKERSHPPGQWWIAFNNFFTGICQCISL